MVRTKTIGEKGAIVGIHLKNFMTYTDVRLCPGPSLNMILGPNGTGKSAIVCAIIVGLAGEVSTTGRASSIVSLVKKGSDWASTEIELFNDMGKNHVISRKIILTRTDQKVEHKSEWTLNNRSVLKTHILKLTESLNIKVDNLCQFLPQDSVSAFVKMNQSELLTNTLKAAGDSKLVDEHSKLIELTTTIDSRTRELNELKESCQQNEVNARRLEGQVERIREKKRLTEQKAICESKLHHVKYIAAKNAFEESKAELTSLEKDLADVEARSEPYRRKIDACRKEEDSVKNIMIKCQEEARNTFSKIEREKTSIESRKTDCCAKFMKFKESCEEEKKREQSIRTKQQELESLECQLNEFRDVDYEPEIRKLTAEIEEAGRNLTKLRNDRHYCEEKLRDAISTQNVVHTEKLKIEGIRERKIQDLKSRRQDYFKVIEWLAKNSNKFQKQVFLPICCEVNVKEPEYSAIVEHAIHEQDLMSFVCQTKEDFQTFTRITRQELHVRCNAILMPSTSLAQLESSSSQQTAYRARTYLKDLIDAPEPILRYLYGSLNFHTIPVLKNATENELKELYASCRRFYVGGKCYTVSRSRYDQKEMTVSDSVREARFLRYSIDKRQLQECRDRLEKLGEERKTFETKRDQICKDEDSVKRIWQVQIDKRNQLKLKMSEKDKISARIDLWREEIERLNNTKIDIQAERQKLNKAIKAINLLTVEDLGRLGKIYESLAELRRDLCLKVLQHILARRNVKIAARMLESVKQDTTRLTDEIHDQKKKLMALRKLLDIAKNTASEKIPGFKEGKLDKATTKKFNTIEHSTVESIERFIEELKAKTQGIGREANSLILSEFERENEEVREKRLKISELESVIEMTDLDRQNMKDDWIQAVNSVIATIHEHYRDFMLKLNYGGEVSLNFDQEKPDNFASYGIMIRVKYRDNEQLIPLSSTRQSGGERSVATMVYMLALQTKTTVPFRCVDEINQGMDKDNERKVFELLVRTADESSSQYFLVSPKLLNNLTYSDKMKIHVVFNGTGLEYAWNDLNSDGDENDEDAVSNDSDLTE